MTGTEILAAIAIGVAANLITLAIKQLLRGRKPRSRKTR